MCKALTGSRPACHASRLVVVVAVVAAYGYTVVVVVVVVFARDAARRKSGSLVTEPSASKPAAPSVPVDKINRKLHRLRANRLGLRKNVRSLVSYMPLATVPVKGKRYAAQC